MKLGNILNALASPKVFYLAAHQKMRYHLIWNR